MLVITVSFALIFTMLGLASLHLAGVYNEQAEKQKSSLKAFGLLTGQ